MVAPCARPSALSAGSESVTLAKARPSVIELLSTVRGARPRLLTPFLPVTSEDCETNSLAAPVKVPTVDGKSRTICATFCAWLPSAPRNISVISRRKVFCLDEATMASSRGSALTSMITLASATAAWPSTAAWCSLVYSATRRAPFVDGARPSKTWNFHSGFLRSSSTGCSSLTAASSAGSPAPLGSLTSTTCCLRSGSASTHAGLAMFSGIHHNLRRSAGVSGKRSCRCWRSATTYLPLKPAGSSKMCSAPTCMGICGVSR